MKTKIVLWGTNEKEEKILLGIELIEKENKVKIFVFPESESKEDFYNLMLNDWRINNPVVFPENHELIERPLSITEDLLPENIKVTRTDVINRAKAEWHFVVLSAKLYQLYKSEIEEFKEKINNLEVFDKNLWEELKAFWKKVQEQAYEKNLFREHAKTLHDETNGLFDKLKEFRKKLDHQFQKESKDRAKVFQEKLATIEQKMADGFGLQPLWNEMKNIQAKFRSENLAKAERNEIWNKIDALFKAIKEKKYGSREGGGQRNSLERIENRYKGLLSAIKKMENSIKWDRKDLNFQDDRIQETYGQLEKEIRSAKLKMIEERIHSKELKLDEMNQTRVMLEGKIEKEKEKLERKKQAEEVKKAKEEIKEKIQAKIKANEKGIEEKLSKVSMPESVIKAPIKEEIAREDTKTSNIKQDISEVTGLIGNQVEDVVDTVKAAGKVLGDKIIGASKRTEEEE